MTEEMAKRVLVVEDEILLAMLLEDIVSDMGHLVVQTASRIDMAMQVATEADIDFAILDLNLGGTSSFPVADILRRRGIPFVFATGYGSGGLTDDYRDHPTLQKPYEPDELKRAFTEAFARLGDQSVGVLGCE